MHRSARGVVIDFAELSDPGRDPTKQINEDSAAYLKTPHGHLAVVCDGMGGHAAGRAASQGAVETIVECLKVTAPDLSPREALKQAIEAAGRAVYSIGGTAPAHLRPGSTCVALLVHERGAEVAHVGDSRAYLIRASSIQRLTRDHSMVQQMVEAGVLDAQRAAEHPDANKLTRALGMTEDAKVELAARPVELRPGDVLLLASDGLTDLVGDDELLSSVQSRIASGPAVCCQELVALANSRGGHDNITVQLLSVVEAPPAREVATPTLHDVGPGRAAPGATLVGTGPSAGELRGTQATVPDEALSGPGPTLFDESGYPARTTQPDLAPTRAAPSARPDAPGAALAHQRAVAAARRGRALFAAAALIAAVIVGAVSLWWLLSPDKARRDPDQPPLPSASAPLTVLEALTDAAPAPDPKRKSDVDASVP